jgi:hypothetical protein
MYLTSGTDVKVTTYHHLSSGTAVQVIVFPPKWLMSIGIYLTSGTDVQVTISPAECLYSYLQCLSTYPLELVYR